MEEEGEWEDTQILLGYEVNVDSLKIRLPDAKIRGSWEVITCPVYKSRNRIIPVKKVRILRGLINHWMGANRFWEYMSLPLNTLMGFSDGPNKWIRRENGRTRISVWALLRFLIRCSRDYIIWDSLFDGSYLDLVPLPTRLSLPLPDFQVIWAAGDAVMGRSAATNWSTNQYSRRQCEFFRRSEPSITQDCYRRC